MNTWENWLGKLQWKWDLNNMRYEYENSSGDVLFQEGCMFNSQGKHKTALSFKESHCQQEFKQMWVAE